MNTHTRARASMQARAQTQTDNIFFHFFSHKTEATPLLESALVSHISQPLLKIFWQFPKDVHKRVKQRPHYTSQTQRKTIMPELLLMDSFF